MADTSIALTAIVVSGVVGPGLAAWWTRERQKSDHEQELRRELRAVLDEGAHALGRTKRAFDRVLLLYRQGVPPDSAEAKEAFLDWRAALADVRYEEDRLAIRLGADHPAHEAFCACMKTLEAQRALAWAYEQSSVTRGMTTRTEKANQRYNPTRRAYIDAAKQLVGVRTVSGENTRDAQQTP
jgi:hypothetical protein